ncbi:Alginate biosynthesis protein AlgA [Thalassoglobus neptunius]|uniref:mannose-1-phosphate guanylyltransferase n=1 Tax=Thalassoglobus neptunius TaxID=1938619 RepID=A0A5C5X8T0_9PLAN|nr:mannose-1-phosphate guanylyltransferase [Thalassoglobus neptunius]TWT58703.1 Alginate biosynthesis protein AlgA [Thalassoglobus neptunius]
MLHAVIMAGGSGTRFWPLSRRLSPKQFLTLGRKRSLIQSVYDRCHPMIASERFWVVTNQQLTSTTQEHLPRIPVSQIIAEPCGRNTAPCIGLAALLIEAADPEATMVVMPADHVIQDYQKFQNAIAMAEEALENSPEELILFGIPPVSPETGYGYIEVSKSDSQQLHQVVGFREKPDLETAKSYVEQGRFLWNSGIFVWRASTILSAIRTHQPEIGRYLDELRSHIGTEQWNEALQKTFPLMPSVSIDYAVLEHEMKLSVVEAKFDWDDVGSWEAMSRLNPQDEAGNTSIGRTCVVDSNDCIIHSSGEQVVTLLGMENCIVVHTLDATLVADRSDQNAIRELVKRLEEQGYDRVL